jgi:hypothetical protein
MSKEMTKLLETIAKCEELIKNKLKEKDERARNITTSTGK